jgi:hypothetical protein
MRYKETIRLIKKALETPWMYTNAEILYMKKSLDSAILALARKKFEKKKKGFGNDGTSKTDSSNS